MHRFIRTLAAVSIAVLGLASCGSDAEAPAGPAPAAAVSPVAAESANLIYVIPVDGVNGAGRLVLADAIAASLRDAKQPAILAEQVNEMGPTVAGHVVTVEERDSVVWVTALWELKAPYGTAVAEFSHQIVVDRNLWQAGAAEAVNLLAFEAAPRVNAMVHDFVSPMAMAALPPADGPPPPAVAAAPDLPAGTAAPALREPMRPPRKPTTVPAPPAGDARAKSPAPAAKAPPPAPKAKPPEKIGRPKALTKAVPGPAAVPRPESASSPEPEPTRQAMAAPMPKSVPKPVPKPVPKTVPDSAPKPVPKPVLRPIPNPAANPAPAPAPKPKPKPVLMPIPGEGPGPLVADPPPVSWGRPAFLIRPVKGAPGDGNTALTKAMKDALRKRDLTVTEDPRQAGFVIEGQVEISPIVAGRQRAKIVWAVNTIAGDEVGKAVQENAVRAGSLDGAWGRVAEIVSNAAVVGIQELFGMEAKQSSHVLDVPKFTYAPDLPQVPGRAMPPPK